MRESGQFHTLRTHSIINDDRSSTLVYVCRIKIFLFFTQEGKKILHCHIVSMKKLSYNYFNTFQDCLFPQISTCRLLVCSHSFPSLPGSPHRRVPDDDEDDQEVAGGAEDDHGRVEEHQQQIGGGTDACLNRRKEMYTVLYSYVPVVN